MRELARTVAALAAALSSATLLLSACHDKNTRVPFVLPVTPTSIVSGNTVVFYTVAARRGTPVIVSFGYSTDGGLTFNPATPAAGTPPASLIPANPAGAPSFFYWDSFKDLGPGFHRNVILAPTGGGVQALTLPFVADETDSFALPRGAQGMARANVLALPLPDDSVYIVGGTQAGAPVGFGEVYDPVSDDVFTAPTGGLSLVRSGFAGALLSSGRVLTAGGADSNGNPLGTAEYFSKVSGLTRPVPSGLVVPRLDPALAPAPGGGAIVAGGLAQGGVPTPSIELYDPGAGQDGGFAVVLTSTLAAVRLPTATALADGRVLFAGGADANGNAVSTAFLVDSVARTVVPTVTNLSFARVGHRATRLSNGKVLLSGGESVLGNAGSALATCEVFDPATLAFTLTGTMNHARAFHGQDLAGGRVLAVGGQGSDPLTASTGESFSQELALWFPTQFPTVSSRTDGQVVVTGAGLALVAGGGAAPELHFPFNAPGPETWTALLSRTQPRADHTAIGYPNGDVLLAGGTSMVASATTSVEMFHPTALTFPALRQPDTFETKAQLKVARAGHAAALVPDGRAVVFGGRDASGSVLGSIEAYDYSLDRWTLLPATLAVPRTNAHAILLGDGTVLVLGGRDASGNPVGLAEVFEPSSGTVSSSGTLGVPRVDEDVSFNGFVIVAGGTDAGGKPLSSIEVYDPVSRTFRAGGSLQVPRAGLALAFSVDTPDLIATGGNDSTGTRGDLEAIDLTTLLPAPVAGFTQLDTPRSFHRASGLDDTSVLLTGGEQGQLVLDASGLYFLIVPAPQGFNALNATVRPTIVPHMNRARTKHTATVLPDGRVLVVGGIDGRGVAIAGGEVFVAPAEVIFTSTPQVFSVPGPQGTFR